MSASTKDQIIYALIAGGEIAYIGRTGNIRTRIAAHRNAGVRFFRHAILAHCSAGRAAATERLFISLFRPALNKRLSGAGAFSHVLVPVTNGEKRAIEGAADGAGLDMPTWILRTLRNTVRRSRAAKKGSAK